MIGFESLTGGGGFSGSSGASSTAGPITVGGLTFAPSNNSATVIGLAVVAAALLGFALLKGK